MKADRDPRAFLLHWFPCHNTFHLTYTDKILHTIPAFLILVGPERAAVISCCAPAFKYSIKGLPAEVSHQLSSALQF